MRFNNTQPNFEEYLKHIIKIMDGVVFSYTIYPDKNDFEYDLMSESCVRILGYTALEYFAQKNLWVSQIFEEDRKQIVRPLITSILENEIYSEINDYRFWHKNGTLRWIHSSISSYKDTKGYIQVIGIATDITESKQREMTLLQAKVQAEQAAIAKEDFLSNISHEIRTPLSAIIGTTELLIRQNPQESQLKNLQVLKFSAETLMALINDLLDYNKLDAEHIQLEKIDFDMSLLVDNLLLSHQEKVKAKQIEFKTEIDSQMPRFLKADPMRLVQILNNLLSNAIKFTEKGSVSFKIKLEEETESELTLYFEISDTGIGIEADKLAMIFERFTQANIEITRKFGGTGLGLAIVKRLVELYGSHIEVKSIFGVGTTFSFNIKFEKSNLTAQADDLAISTQLTEKTSTFGEDRMPQILVVDDSEINQFIIQQFLKSWNMQFEMALNGKIALEKIQEKTFDLILMDLEMPEMNGYETTIELRKFTKIPIIALTAHTPESIVTKIRAVGMNDYILKPFKIDDMYGKILIHLQNPLLSPHPTPNPNDSINKPSLLGSILYIFEGDLEFQEEFKQLHIKLFEEIKNVALKALFENNPKALKNILHRTMPSIDMLRLHDLELSMKQIIQLIQTDEQDDAIKNIAVNELHKICDDLITDLKNK